MELHRPQSTRLAHLDRGGEALPIIRVAVIDEAAIRNASQQATLRRAVLTDFKLAPADVRHFEHTFKATDTPRQNSQARKPGRFIASFIKRLQAEADSKKRLRLLQHLPQRLHQSVFFECLHHRGKVPLTGENDLARRRELLRAVDDTCLMSEILDRPQDRARVAGAVIEQRDHSKPLVEGSWRLRRESREQAYRKARAKALNSASTAW